MAQFADEKLLSAFAAFEGLVCLRVVAGSSTGSIVSLDFGINMAEVSESGSIFIFGAAWRLDCRGLVLTGSNDTRPIDFGIRAGLQNLIGKKILGIKTLNQMYDLEISAEDGLFLRIFCDQISAEDGMDNYYVFLGKEVFTVLCRSELEIQQRG